MCLGEREPEGESGSGMRESGRSKGHQALRLLRGSARSSWHLRQKITPRNVQMMQMNVPQLSQGYPSDARSSLLQDRQIIASRSRRIWRIKAIWTAGLVEDDRRTLRSLNLHYGPHLTTRLAACSQLDSRSGPTSGQPSGTGARRRFSPSLSKQSQPLLNSLATSTVRRKGLFLRSRLFRRS